MDSPYCSCKGRESEPWLTAVIPTDDPYCSCKLTRAVGRTLKDCWLSPTEISSLPEVRSPTTRTILQKDGPNHLGLRRNALPEHQMSLIT